MRIETHPSRDPSDAFFRPSRKGQNCPQSHIAVGIVGIESDGSLFLGDGLLVLLFPHIDPAQLVVGPWQRAIQSNGLLSKFKGPLQGLGVMTPYVPPL